LARLVQAGARALAPGIFTGPQGGVALWEP